MTPANLASSSTLPYWRGLIHHYGAWLPVEPKTPVVTLEFALRQLPRPGDADGRKTGVTRPPDSRR